MPPEKNLKHQQLRFNAFVKEFNNERPHEALNIKMPAEIYTPSEVRYNSNIIIEYPKDYIKRLVSAAGQIKFFEHQCRISSVLNYEYIGMEEIDDGVYNIYYSWYLIGRYFMKNKKLMDVITRLQTTPRHSEKCYL